MNKTMHNFSDRLKELRTKYGYTQAELASKLSITRASVNAWEMGLSSPSTPFLVELSLFFHVTTDYLLGLSDSVIIRTDNLSEREITALLNIVKAFNDSHNEDIG